MTISSVSDTYSNYATSKPILHCHHKCLFSNGFFLRHSFLKRTKIVNSVLKSCFYLVSAKFLLTCQIRLDKLLSNFKEGTDMKCDRCDGVMAYEKFYGGQGPFWGWRCIFCGEIIDDIILENRQWIRMGAVPIEKKRNLVLNKEG